MGAASQGEGTGHGSGGHAAKGVTMGMRREAPPGTGGKTPPENPPGKGTLPPWLGGKK